MMKSKEMLARYAQGGMVDEVGELRAAEGGMAAKSMLRAMDPKKDYRRFRDALKVKLAEGGPTTEQKTAAILNAIKQNPDFTRQDIENALKTTGFTMGDVETALASKDAGFLSQAARQAILNPIFGSTRTTAPKAGESALGESKGAFNALNDLIQNAVKTNPNATREDVLRAMVATGANEEDLRRAGYRLADFPTAPPAPKVEVKETIPEPTQVSVQPDITQAQYEQMAKPVTLQPLDTKFRESSPRTAQFDRFGRVANYNYGQAAKLKPATGTNVFNWTPPTITSKPRSLLNLEDVPGVTIDPVTGQTRMPLSASQRFARDRTELDRQVRSMYAKAAAVDTSLPSQMPYGAAAAFRQFAMTDPTTAAQLRMRDIEQAPPTTDPQAQAARARYGQNPYLQSLQAAFDPFLANIKPQLITQAQAQKSYFERNPDVAKEYSNPSSEFMKTMKERYPSPEAFSQWHYQTYGQAENRGSPSMFSSPYQMLGFKDGGEATTEDFLKKQSGGDVSRGTSSPETRGVSSLKGYGEGEEAASIRRSAHEALRGLMGMRPYEETNPSEAYRIASTATPLTMIGGGIRGMKKIAGSEEAAKAIGKAAEAAGMKAPVTASKSLTTLDDFHLSLGDQIRKRSADMQDLIESTPFKYSIGDRVFTADSARKNRPPLEILNRVMVGNDPMREGHPILGKVVKDPETGKTKRTPYEPGYEVLLFEGKDNWTKFRIPESAIKGVIDPIEPLEKQDGGEASTEEFIKKNVSRGTSPPNTAEVPQLDAEGRLIDENAEMRSESQRMLNRLKTAQQESYRRGKLPPGIQRAVTDVASEERPPLVRGKAVQTAGDVIGGLVSATPREPTNPSESYRLMQGFTGAYLPTAPVVRTAQAAKMAAQEPRATMSAARQSLEALGDIPVALAQPNQLGSQAGVIKPKGGNWLANAISDEMQNLKVTRFDNDPVAVYEDMKRVYTPEVMSRLSPETLQQVKEGFAALKPQVAINKWIDTKLAKYMQNEFATPEDPVRALIERGISPARNPGDINPIYDYNNVFEKRKEAGFPVEGLAETEAGRNWEEMADSSINVSYLKNLLSSLKDRQESKYGMIRNEANRTLRDNPWLNKLTLPYTPIYGQLGANHRPVFNHVIDELQNAMATNSGLPKNLQLDPDDLSKMNVPQVVELVDKINKWRVDNIKNLQLEETLKADLYKVYPEKNYRWVQLNRPGQFAAESDAMGHSVRGYEPPDKGGSDYYGLGGFKAIQSGEAKIYSLRDEKGQPHVTIEVASNPIAPRHTDIIDEMKRSGLDPKSMDATSYEDAYNVAQKAVEERQPSRILQIKGKGNEAPAKKYLPFIQDFVKSGNWSQVNDLRNAGLAKIGNKYLTTEEYKSLVDSAVRYLERSPALEPHRRAQREFDNYQNTQTSFVRSPKYQDLRNRAGMLVHPRIPYTYREMTSIFRDPEAYDPDSLGENLERVNLLRQLYGEEGFARGGEVNVPRETSTSKKQLDKLAQVSQRKKA